MSGHALHDLLPTMLYGSSIYGLSGGHLQPAAGSGMRLFGHVHLRRHPPTASVQQFTPPSQSSPGSITKSPHTACFLHTPFTHDKPAIQFRAPLPGMPALQQLMIVEGSHAEPSGSMAINVHSGAPGIHWQDPAPHVPAPAAHDAPISL